MHKRRQPGGHISRKQKFPKWNLACSRSGQRPLQVVVALLKNTSAGQQGSRGLRLAVGWRRRGSEVQRKEEEVSQLVWVLFIHSSYNRLFLPFMFGPLDLICSWTDPDGGRPSAISPEPMCVRWMKLVGSPIMLRSIFLLFFFGGGLATTQQPILCQKSLMPMLRLSSGWLPLSAAALQAGGGSAAWG